MKEEFKSQTAKLTLAQMAWVVKDLDKTKLFFQNMLGVKNFSPVSSTRLQDYDSTYYGERADAENLVTMAYSDGTFIEIIQPVSGRSIFKDHLDEHPAGGLQHIAYSTPIANLDDVISEFESRGYKQVSSFDTPIAKIIFFDTRAEIGLFTEIMGITTEGEQAVQEMKRTLGQ